MAESVNSILLHNLRGQIGKQMVVKQYGRKTVVTKYPDMSKVKPSKLQKAKRNDFAEAVAYAQSILHDSVKKKAYAKKLKKGVSVYQAAIREWMGKRKGK
jgi:hypothetical protein